MPTTKALPFAAATPRAWRNLDLTFGLVSAGVSVAPLMESTHPRANIICAEHREKVTLRKHCASCNGEPVEAVKGYDVSGEYVTVDESALEALSTSNVQLTACVEAGAIDPLYFERSYAIWPQKTEGAANAYALLLAALRDSGKALVGEAVLTKSTRMLVVRYSSVTGTLVGHLCHPGAELRTGLVESVRRIADGLPAADASEIGLAEALLDALGDRFDPDAVPDSFTLGLTAAIEAAAKGGPAPAPHPAGPDMLDLLRESVAKTTTAPSTAKAKTNGHGRKVAVKR